MGAFMIAVHFFHVIVHYNGDYLSCNAVYQRRNIKFAVFARK